MRKVLFILALVAGCKSEQTQDVSANAPASVHEDSAEAMNTESQVPVATETGVSRFEFVNDDIGADPFDGDMKTILATVGQYDISKEIFRNLHDSTKMDTIKTIRFGTSSIEYFQGANSGFIISAEITHPDVKFKKGIAIGMGEEKFKLLFEELRDAQTLNSVTITTLEGLAYSEFLFSSQKLTTVKYQSYFD